MLLRFSFSNFRSFRDEQELSLVASPIKGAAVPREITGVKEGVLPVAAIYGANASGKTNVLRASDFMSDAVRHSQTRWEPGQSIPRSPFFGNEATPSRFVADFIVDDTRYEYGFTADSDSFLEEWLYAYPRGGRKQTWFQRSPGLPISFGAKMPGDNRAIESLTRSNSLFLSAAAQSNHAALTSIYRWFSVSLSFVMGDRSRFVQRAAEECTEREFEAFATKMLATADLGITGVKIGRVLSIGEMMHPDFDRSNSGRPVLSLVHQFGDKAVPLALTEESYGTIAYLALLHPIVKALKTSGVVCSDEFDSGLHPLLAIETMRLFNGPSTRAQLIFNTHDTICLAVRCFDGTRFGSPRRSLTAPALSTR